MSCQTIDIQQTIITTIEKIQFFTYKQQTHNIYTPARNNKKTNLSLLTNKVGRGMKRAEITLGDKKFRINTMGKDKQNPLLHNNANKADFTPIEIEHFSSCAPRVPQLVKSIMQFQRLRKTLSSMENSVREIELNHLSFQGKLRQFEQIYQKQFWFSIFVI